MPQVPPCSIPPVATYQTRPCEECGRPVERNVDARRRWLCIACAERRVEQNARDIAAKRGPGYRRWKAGQLVYLARLSRGEDYPAMAAVEHPLKAPDVE